jgi:hypothetical protein
MRNRALRLLALVVAVPLVIALLVGQDRPSPPAPTAPAPATAPGTSGDAVPAVVAEPARPPAAARSSKWTPLQKQFSLSAQRGADWLFRMNGVKGRFLIGFLPALKTELEGDHYLRQAGATCALAQVARFCGEERYAARATQAILALLEETGLDSADPTVRFCTLPPGIVNKLGAAGLLVLAIHELPAPQADLLEKADQLCNYIRRCARPDGSLALEGVDASTEALAVQEYPGLALQALMRSQTHRPAAWKTDIVRKAVEYYRGWWKKNPSLALVASQTPAYAEAFVRTHDKVFADFVVEMNDRVCELQYAQIHPRHLLWFGGFKGYVAGREVETPPDYNSAAPAEGLAWACRVAREMHDEARIQRYSETVERGLQFLTTLQYTDANTQHFAEWYRPRLAGAFHASHQDGDLRIDYTQHAVSAFVTYLEQGVP